MFSNKIVFENTTKIMLGATTSGNFKIPNNSNLSAALRILSRDH